MDDESTRPDPIIHSFIEERWREAIDQVHKAMESIREVVPEMVSVLDEGDARHLTRALSNLQDAYGDLHQAGPGAIGESDYETFLASRIDTHIEEREHG